MNKPELFRPPGDDHRRSEDIDPWNEFLSESSSELQELQRTEDAVSRPAPVVSIVRLARDAPDTAAANRPVAPTIEAAPPDSTPSPVAPSLLPDAQPPIPARVEPDARDTAPQARSARPFDVRGLALSQALSIRDVLNRQVGVQWAEAVATLEELCLALGDDETGDVPIPELTDVLLTRTGEVTVRPGAPGDPEVAALGRTLSAMLAASTTPLPLRLFVTSSSTAGRYRSIALYRDALSYYAAAGDRRELIRALYQRAADAASAAIPPQPRATVAPEPRRVVGKVQRTVPSWAAAAAVGVAVGSLASVWVLRSTPAPQGVITVSGAPTPVRSVARDDWQLGDVVTSEPRRQTAGASPAQPPVPASARARPPAPAAATMREAPPAPIPTRGVADPLAPVLPPGLRDEPAQMPTRVPPTLESTPPPADTRIYSSADADVQPPVMLSRRPDTPMAISPSDSRVENTVELVIDEKGNVKTARLLNRPTRLTDINYLPPLKLLKFQPARKDGQAVSYQYILRFVDTPR